jgi:ribosomal protein L22
MLTWSRKAFFILRIIKSHTTDQAIQEMRFWPEQVNHASIQMTAFWDAFALNRMIVRVLLSVFARAENAAQHCEPSA